MMDIERIPGEFTICKVEDYSTVDLSRPFHFAGSTDRERSLVCPTEYVPANAIIRDSGWRAFRIAGTLDFSLVGILAHASALLAERGIGIFAVSTYDTDYILTKSENYERALDALAGDGWRVV